MKPVTVIFIGPQGSGKGTQVDVLKKWLKEQSKNSILYIQTGKPFRELTKKNSHTAEVVKDLIESGRLVPSCLTNALVMQEFVSGMKKDSHVLFDGYPRDIEQAKTVEEMLSFYDRKELIVVFLDTSEEVVVERMLKRGRSDDTKEAIAERLRLYRESTAPLIELYKGRPSTTFIQVDGTQPIEVVSKDIQQKIEAVMK